MSMNSASGFNYLNSFLVQESIAIMFVALGLSILGIIYGRTKTKEFFHLHRWTMSGAIILTLVSIFFVMFPSFAIYYINPIVDVFSGFSILQITHFIIGIPTMILAATYLFNDLPKFTKKWMQITIILWLISMISGAIIYYTMPS